MKSRTRARWRIIVAAVLVVPLAVVGLVIAALADSDTAIDRLPAAVVNNDELRFMTAPDGTETPVFAGRQVVTELTGAHGQFDWTITNDADADRMLRAGDVYAVVTIPADFSDSVLSLSGDNPTQAKLDIRTDDAHSYLASVLATTVGDSIARALGTTVTAQYVSGIQSGTAALGDSLGQAADAAGAIADGTAGLGGGLESLTDGAETAAGGARSLAQGIRDYTAGVDSLSEGLGALADNSAGLGQLSGAVSQYTQNVAALSAALAAATANLQANPSDPVALGTVDAINTQLAALAAGGGDLSTQVAAGAGGIRDGISGLAGGAAALAEASPGLRSGASGLASGLGQIAGGATDAASGARELADGAQQLADGLQSGAEQVPTASDDAADVIADPVGFTHTRDNPVDGLAPAIATLAVPVGLWLGALALFLVMRPVSRTVLESTASAGRIVAHVLGRAFAVTAAQAGLLVVLLHTAAGVPWSALAATLSFSLCVALAFTALHAALTLWFGRAGGVVSIVLIALQAAVTGGLYPVQLLSAPFAAVSPLLPLTHAVAGLQAIIASGSVGTVVGSAVVLVLFAALGAVLSVAAVRRARRVRWGTAA